MTQPTEEPKPKTFDEAFKNLALTDEDQAALNEKKAEDDEGPEEVPVNEPVRADGAPEWAQFPPDMAVPEGRELGFILFRASWMDEKKKGDRNIILWSLTDADEKLALKRVRGEQARTLGEMAKQMIRSIDGVKADWTGKVGPGNVERFWNDIGAKCRGLVANYYLKTHALAPEERADFFMNCLVVRNVVAG